MAAPGVVVDETGIGHEQYGHAASSVGRGSRLRIVGPAMSRLGTITWGAERFRVGPWHGDERVAYLAVGTTAIVPSVSGVHEVLDRLRNDGFARVMTSALRPQEVPAFLAAGFAERERLVVLQRSLAGVARATSNALRRIRPGEMGAVLAVDHLAFEAPWRLDAAGIDEALHATPRSRLRVGVDSGRERRGEVSAYAICGRAGRTGYLQRLAVDPRQQGRGLGRDLVVDALAWLERRHATSVLVNTQETNHRAIELYRSLGFEPDRAELIVLERDL
jgi:GNAT superfamily N-acetyltransferase